MTTNEKHLHKPSAIESLERRTFLSASEVDAWVSRRGTLLIVGTDSSDSITVKLRNPWIYVRAGDDAERFRASTVKRVRADMGEGNDFFHNYVNKRATVNGESGNDTIVGSAADDSIDGGAGDDLLLPVSIRANIINGGGGADVVDYETEAPGSFGLEASYDRETLDGSGPLTVRRGEAMDTILHPNGITVRLTLGDDAVGGVAELPLTIDMGDGNDSYGANGLGGDVASVLPTVTVRGGAGNDDFPLRSESVYAAIFGDAGNDRIDDSGAFTSEGNGTTVVDGGAGEDWIDVHSSNVRTEYRMPAGIELLSVAASGLMNIVGNELDNKIAVEQWGGVTIRGGAGDDQIFGGEVQQNETTVGLIDGEAGNDTIVPGFGPEIIRGGSGTDVIRYQNRTGPVSVTFDALSNDGSFEDEIPELLGVRDNVANDVETIG